MDVKSSKKSLPFKIIESMSKYSLTFVSIYFVTFFIYRDFGVKMSLGYALLALLLFSNIINVLLVEKNIFINQSKFIFLFFVTMIFFFFLRPSSIKDKDSFAYIIMMFLMLGFIFTTQEKKRDIDISLQLICIVGLIFSISVIFFQIFQEQYWTIVFPILSDSAQIYAHHHFFNGYSMSIGGVAYTLYMIIFAFFITFSRLLNFKMSKNKKILSYVSLLLFFVAILITGRRGELMSFIFSLILFFLVSAPKEKRWKRIKVMFITSAILLALLVALLPYLNQVEVLQRHIRTINSLFGLSSAEGAMSDISSGRLDLYKEAWNIFLDKPVLGIGSGQFAKVSTDVGVSAEGAGLEVHNILLQLLAETGLVGFFLILTPYIYLYYETIRCNLDLLESQETLEGRHVYFTSSVSFLLQTFLIVTAMVDPINFKIVFWPMFYIAFYLHSYSLPHANACLKGIKVDFDEKNISIS